METIIDKMKPLQILYNLQKAGINIDNILSSKDLSKEYYEEWANKILDENKELFDEQMRKEFLNYIVYGNS